MNALLSLLSLSSLLITINGYSMPNEEFNTYIGNRCFNESGYALQRLPLLLGQNYPVGLSVENLISLIEKVERKRPDLSAAQLVVMMLRRFHIDGLQLTPTAINSPSYMEKLHQQITNHILSIQNPSAPQDFPEETLTEDEKCALFFTLSHTVNDSARYDDDTAHTYQRQRQLVGRAPPNPAPNVTTTVTNTSRAVASEFLTANKTNDTKPLTNYVALPPKKPQASLDRDGGEVVDKDEEEEEEEERKRRKRETLLNKAQHSQLPPIASSTHTVTRFPREKGVASFRNNKDEAIAMNRVLLGVAVGLNNIPTRSVRDTVKSMRPDAQVNNIPDGQIDPLLAVTLSDLLGIDGSSGLSSQVGVLKFGAEGEWNSTACQTTYKFNIENGTLATLAEIRGGLDGWNIGRKIQELLQTNPNIKLSQILRTYYSQFGISPDTGYCRREYFFANDLENKLAPEAKNYIRIWNQIHYFGEHHDTKLTGYIDQTWDQFRRAVTRALEKSSDIREYCTQSISTDIKQAPCESMSDVFVVLDGMNVNDDSFKEQIEVVTQVARSLDLRRGAGSVSVFLNADGLANNPSVVDDDNIPVKTPLYTLAYNSTSSQCVSCKTAWYDNMQTNIRNRVRMMELLNKTLMEFELRRANEAGVPAKSVVWFNYETLEDIPTVHDQKRKYEDIKWRLMYEHRDVSYFLMSLNQDNILDLIRHKEDWFVMGKGVDYARESAQQLTKKICRTPSTFQHNECRVSKSADKAYEGFITPGYKQYWAMYPEYFIKSYNIDLKFKAENAKIKVCYDRRLEPEREERHCKESAENGAEVLFQVSNPCRGRTFENCEPLYFTIALSTQSATSAGQPCTDIRCKSTNQVKWTFTHTGVACSPALRLKVTSWQLISACLVIFLSVFVSKK